MKKNLISVLVALFIVVMSTGTAIAAPNVVLNGNKLLFNVPPIVEDGRTLVPLRTIFEALGATVTWDEDSQTVTATKGSTTIKLQIGAHTATLNDKTINLSVPGKVVNGRTMVPCRFVSEAMGCQVDWAEETQTVVITDNSNLDSSLVIYSDPKGRFAITYPSDWIKVDNINENTSFAVETPQVKVTDDSEACAMILIHDLNPNVDTSINSLHAFIKSYIMLNSSEYFTNPKIISETYTVVDGLPAVEMDFTATMNGKFVTIKWTGLFNNGHFIQIMALTMEPDNTAMVNKLDSIIKSIQIVH